MRNQREYLRSQKIVKRRRKQTARKYFLYAILILILFFGCVGITHLQAVTIQTVEVEGNHVVPSTQISTTVEKMLDGTFLHLFSTRNALFYPSSHIEAELKKAYPRFSSVIVHAVSPTKIKVVVEERKPKSLWCKANGNIATPVITANNSNASSTESDDTSEQCYFIDSEGIIFSLAPNFQGNAYLKFYGGDIDAQPIGKALMSSSTYNSMVDLSDKLEQQNLPISFIKVRDIHNFSVKLKNNGNILFSDQKSFTDAYNNLLAALTSEVFTGKQAKASTTAGQTILPFEYIDMRFGNKIFFKLKSASVTSTTSSTTQQTYQVQ